MRAEAPCGKCGSTRMVPRARVVGRGESSALGLGAVVHRNPEAVLFKGAVTADTYARVCGDCGFIELFAEEPESLYRAYVESKK